MSGAISSMNAPLIAVANLYCGFLQFGGHAQGGPQWLPLGPICCPDPSGVVGPFDFPIIPQQFRRIMLNQRGNVVQVVGFKSSLSDVSRTGGGANAQQTMCKDIEQDRRNIWRTGHGTHLTGNCNTDAP